MTSEETKETHLNNESNHSNSLPSTSTNIPYIEWMSRCEELLYFFGSHKAAGTLRDNEFLEQSFLHCSELFARDGAIITIDNNAQQELCDSYPIKIILQQSFIQHIDNSSNYYDYLCRLLERARYARVHRRFVVPVIFLPNNACIARSSTLSTTGELLLNKATSVVSEALNYYPNAMESPMGHDLSACRAADIKLLNYFNIKFIADLMVEDKKKVGWGRYALTVTSSEKVDREHRYKDFKLSSIPYPGCEFFKRYRDNKHDAKRLVFEWDANIHDAKMNLIEIEKGNNNIDWTQYKEWDIIRLTQNYLRLIMDYVESSFNEDANEQNGVLIHCISGWDRTPLFISLIRLSLWADGVIHSDLDCSQILYLTLSYDWLLFTHQFGNRLIKGEDIFHFTFYMLQFIINDRYSLFYDDSTATQTKHTTNNNKQEAAEDVQHGELHNALKQHNKSKKEQLFKKLNKFREITKEQTRKIGKATKDKMSKMKSRSSTNILNKYISANHFKINPNTTSDRNGANMNGYHCNSDKTEDHNHTKNGAMQANKHNTEYHHANIEQHTSCASTHYKLSPFSPPVHIQIPASLEHLQSKSVNRSNINNLSHSWEKKGCGPLSSNIRHSYIPTQRTPPSFNKTHSTNSPTPKLIMPSPNPLQIVRTHTATAAHTPIQRRNKMTSWQFVDQKNDSPMFQYISTPKSDPAAAHPTNHISPPDLELNEDENDDASISSVSSGDIKINSRYSLSAPSSTTKAPQRDATPKCLNFNDFMVNESASASPQIITHPENKIIDMNEQLQDAYEENENMSKRQIVHQVIDDVIEKVVNISSTQKYQLQDIHTMKSAKSTPVTISDFLGLKESELFNNEARVNVPQFIKEAESYEMNDDDNNNEINVEKVLESMVNMVSNNAAPDGEDSGNNNDDDDDDVYDERHLRSRRSDRLLQVYSLFNKVYTQVMIINEAPTFYKQSVESNHSSNDDILDANDGDNIDFISSDKYQIGSDIDPYNNITTYLRSILPSSLIGNANDEYDDD